jgi:hypothetical protein
MGIKCPVEKLSIIADLAARCPTARAKAIIVGWI